ncbi:MAG TPA: DegT/DnrJ/EryC1/StrS family aminotransferase [Pyrinomonadaceae bacterium]|jgi:dTDP-4-amino-4,6-dideoxygalactose transaminase|nr:DegT/DnrJ/EryC1/StrS family aminotransferase [Pyrinomonadaceae bacterium]
MRIPFLDLKRQHREIEAEAQAALSRVMARGSYILGPEVEAFEEEWARFCGVRAAAGVGNGTDALSLALNASGAVRPGARDEVITSALTAGYTALAIINAGGVPVFADIHPQTHTLDPADMERAVTPRTRAVVPVHLYGRMADMSGVCEVAARHNLTVVEDAAQSHGALKAGKRAGAHGHVAAFSFYPTKNLGAYGDGGMVVSDDASLIDEVKVLRQGGHPSAFDCATAGRNSRLDEMQAALLRVKLKYLEDANHERRRLAAIYDDALKDTGLQLPPAGEPGAHVYHLYVVEHDERERLRAHLTAFGIETMIHYPHLLHQQTLFRQAMPQQPRALPVAERAAGRIFSLPLYPRLEERDVRAVAEAILRFKA